MKLVCLWISEMASLAWTFWWNKFAKLGYINLANRRPKAVTYSRKKPRFRWQMASAKNLGFGVGFRIHNNTIQLRTSSSSPRLPLCQILFLSGPPLLSYAMGKNRILNHSLNHSPTVTKLIWCSGNRSKTSELHRFTCSAELHWWLASHTAHVNSWGWRLWCDIRRTNRCKYSPAATADLPDKQFDIKKGCEFTEAGELKYTTTYIYRVGQKNGLFLDSL